MKKLAFLSLVPLLLLALCLSCGSEGAASRVSAGESAIDLRSCVAVLRDSAGSPIVQVIFFAADLSQEEMDQVASASFSRDVGGKAAVFRMDFWLKEGSTALEFASLTNYGVRFYDSEAFPVPATTGWAQVTFGTTPWEAGTFGITQLQGTLQPGETVRARVKWADECTDSLDPGVDSLALTWDVEVDCPLRTGA